MKYALKNRPQLNIHYTPEENLDQYETWFDGFEKELREKLIQLKIRHKEIKEDPESFSESDQSILLTLNEYQQSTIKEILGEAISEEKPVHA